MRAVGMFQKVGVSTHAPLRGATLFHQHDVVVSDGFNPRTPAGCDSFLG